MFDRHLPKLLALALAVLLFAPAAARADELEGIYSDGDARVTVRRAPGGTGYLVERTTVVNGVEQRTEGLGRVVDGRLVVELTGSSDSRSTSMTGRLGELSGESIENDVSINFTLSVKDAAARRIAELPVLPSNQTTGTAGDTGSSPTDLGAAPTADGSSSIGADQTTSAGSTPPVDTSNEARAPTDPKGPSPFLAALAVAGAMAAAGAGSSRQSESEQRARHTGGAGGGTDPLQRTAAELELEALRLAEEEAAELEFTWQEPDLPDEADLRALTGSTGELTEAERMVLEYTRLQILEGGSDTDLARNLEDVASWRPRMFTEADARALDGSDSNLLSPIEQEILRYTNQQIATGGTNVDLAQNYETFLEIYRQNQSAEDAAALYEAMDGLGTDEDAIIQVLGGKTNQQIDLLEDAFNAELRRNGESTSSGDHDSALERWLDGELSGGWQEKVDDAYAARPVREDSEYFWSSSAAKSWNEFIKESDQGARYMLEHGNLLEQGIGAFNQAIFGGAREVNEHVEYAQQFYMRAAQNSDNGAVRFAANTGFVLASIGGSLGTKALDPTLDYHQTEEGLVDLALLVGTFGAGKLVQAGARTATGVRALTRVSAAMQQLSRLSFGLRRAVGLNRSAAKLGQVAQRYRQLAGATRNAQRAERALAAAARYEAAATQAARAENAIQAAQRAEQAARQAIRATSNADEAARLAEEAVRLSRIAKQEIEALRVAQASAKEAARAASFLNNNTLARGVDDSLAALNRPVQFGRSARTLRVVSSRLDDGVSGSVARELRDIVRGATNNRGPMTGRQFNQLMDDLAGFAERNGVQITRTTETVGVYPKGLYEIQLAGFDKARHLDAAVSFAKRHELAHIVHTLQTRATIARSLSPSGARLTGAQLAEAEEFLKLIEGGANYRQFEKAVTGIAGAAHRTERARDVGLYAQRVEDLIDGTRNGLHVGKVRFPNGHTFEEVYAMFLSKAPAVVGTGLKDLAARFPAMLFGTLYAGNMPVTAYGLDPREFGIDPADHGGTVGFRDFINALITEGYHPE